MVRQARKINKIQRKLRDTDLNESFKSDKSVSCTNLKAVIDKVKTKVKILNHENLYLSIYYLHSELLFFEIRKKCHLVYLQSHMFKIRQLHVSVINIFSSDAKSLVNMYMYIFCSFMKNIK